MVACVAWRFFSNLSALRERRDRDNERQSRRRRQEPNCLKTSLNRQATQANKWWFENFYSSVMFTLQTTFSYLNDKQVKYNELNTMPAKCCLVTKLTQVFFGRDISYPSYR